MKPHIPFSLQIKPHEPKAVLVVSPLVSLMEDQLQAFRSMDMKVCPLFGSISEDVIAQLQTEQDVILVSPEVLARSDVKRILRRRWRSNLAAVVFDEAHCISTWLENHF